MRKKRNKVYVNVNDKNHEIIYTGISFCEFMKYLPQKVTNILLLKADYISDKNVNNFELIEGKQNLKIFSEEDIYNYGDFSFVDYSESECIKLITDNQIAELLFLSHMCRPLATPFYESLNNRFVYLSHDDDYFCKLYCRDVYDFLGVLNGKIINMIRVFTKIKISNIDKGILDILYDFSKNGLLLDFEDMVIKDTEIIIDIFTVGKYKNIDEVLNNSQSLKNNAIIKKQLKYKEYVWHME